MGFFDDDFKRGQDAAKETIENGLGIPMIATEMLRGLGSKEYEAGFSSVYDNPESWNSESKESKKSSEDVEATTSSYDGGGSSGGDDVLDRLQDKIWLPLAQIGAALCGISGLAWGYSLWGVGGAILLAAIGALVGYLLFLIAVPLVMMGIRLAVAAAVIAGIIFAIYSLWGVGKQPQTPVERAPQPTDITPVAPPDKTVEADLLRVAALVDAGGYDQAEQLLNDLDQRYAPAGPEVAANWCLAQVRGFAETRVLLKQQLRKLNGNQGNGLIQIEGSAIEPFDDPGSDAYWGFALHLGNYNYTVRCSNLSDVSVLENGSPIKRDEALSLLKAQAGVPVEIMVTQKTNRYIEEYCRRSQGCDGFCPDTIAFTTSNYPDGSQESRAPETPVSAPVEAAIQNAWLTHNVIRSGMKGMEIHSKFRVANSQGSTCKIIGYFQYSGGQPLKDANGNYATDDGCVSVGVDFTPNYIDMTYNDFVLFIPYDELHLPNGRTSLLVQTKVYKYGVGFLAQSTLLSLWYQK